MQIAFRDKTELFVHIPSKSVTFVDKEGAVATCSTSEAQRSENKDLRKRVNYCRE